ncbi:UNVERIFIED_CONTAM: hypothetical protein K2H54_008238 [Gekko kuhli]
MRPLHPQKRFLLVGEGNFSFSAGLCKVRGDEAHIIATCYESEDAVSRQEFAMANIQYLRDRGAEVHFCVDCIKLKERFLPAERDFDRIYFNFPHCGRKAGVKKNKELLVGFFCRSQDKSFCVEGALNHIFTRSLPLLHPRPLICQTELEGKSVSFRVPEIFRDKINRGFLDVNSEHPVRTVNEKLLEGLGKSLPIRNGNRPLSLVFQGSSNSSFPLDSLWMVPVAERNPDSESVAEKNTRETETFPSEFPNWEVVQETEFPPETLLALSGPVFRKCKISPCALPVFHEALFICVVEKGSEDTRMQLFAESLTETLNPPLKAMGFKLACTTDEPDPAKLGSFVASELQLCKPKYLNALELDASDPEPKSCCVGTIGFVPRHPTSTGRGIVCASLNLDLIAMHVCSIRDWRMLWTSDERFLNQFSAGNLDGFESFSLYPPSYVHDLSFWAPEPERFNEAQFHATVRHVSRESVVSVQLLDRFQHPETAQTSLCYRLTYQSCDKALRSQQAAAMQLELRKEIVRSLHVTLR